METLHGKLTKISRVLDKSVEVVCVFILAALVLVVWVGILSRYLLPWNLTFTEEMARYMMIWVALLSVSIGISRRQHIGMLIVFESFPRILKKISAFIFDVVAFAFFAVVFYKGLGYVERGFSQVTMIFGVPRGYPYLIIPISSGMACLQLVVSAFRDILEKDPTPATSRA